MPFLGSKDFPTTVIDAGTSGSFWRARVTGGSATAVLLLSASDTRIHASIYNHVNASLFVGFDHPGVGTGSFDVKLTSGSFYELPRPVPRGRVFGIWDASGGVAMVYDVSGSVG